jgi:hypothetical protein
MPMRLVRLRAREAGEIACAQTFCQGVRVRKGIQQNALSHRSREEEEAKKNIAFLEQVRLEFGIPASRARGGDPIRFAAKTNTFISGGVASFR